MARIARESPLASVQNVQKSPWPTKDQRVRERKTKREAVLNVAVRLFNERGFHSTSLDDVARLLNVTKPTIYYYFANKDEILFACVRRGLEAIRAAAEPAGEGTTDGMTRLRAVMRNYALVMTEDFGKCVTRTADHELSDTSKTHFRALKREIDTMIRGVVEVGIADGSIAPGDPKTITFMIAGALNWIARWHEPGGEKTPQEIAEDAVAFLVRGLAPRGTEG